MCEISAREVCAFKEQTREVSVFNEEMRKYAFSMKKHEGYALSMKKRAALGVGIARDVRFAPQRLPLNWAVSVLGEISVGLRKMMQSEESSSVIQRHR